MELLHVLHISLILFTLILSADAQTCYLLYYHCTGYDWCCPDGYVCTGSSTCLSIGAIVGACIGAIIGLAFLIFFIYLCCRSNKRTVGTVVQQNPGAGTTVVSSQQGYGMQPQYGQQQYGQPPTYGQQPAGDPAYPPKY